MNWNNAYFDDYPYAISAKSHVWQMHPELGDKAGKEFGKLWRLIFEKREIQQAERELRRCIQQWPDIAGFQFLLAECIAVRNIDEARNILASIVRDSPTSIFATFGQMIEVIAQIKKGSFQLPDFLLGEEIPHLNDLFPSRTQFHAFEVYTFEVLLHYAMSRVPEDERYDDRETPYYLGLADGEWNYHLLLAARITIDDYAEDDDEDDEDDEYDDDDDDDEYDDEDDDDEDDDEDDEYDDEYDDDDDEFLDPMREAWRQASHARVAVRLEALQSAQKPDFARALTHDLTHLPVLLTPELKARIEAEAPAALIADQEAALRFHVANSLWFEEHAIRTENVIHALLLLCNFQSVASAPAMIQLLQQPRHVLDFIMGDLLTQRVPQWLALIQLADPHAFDSLLCDIDAHLYARIAVLSGLEQVGFYDASRILAIEDQLRDLLVQLTAPDRQDYNLPTMLAEVTVIASSLKLSRLFADLEPYFDQNQVDLAVMGDYADAQMFYDQAPADWEIKDLHVGDLSGLYSTAVL